MDPPRPPGVRSVNPERSRTHRTDRDGVRLGPDSEWRRQVVDAEPYEEEKRKARCTPGEWGAPGHRMRRTAECDRSVLRAR